MVDPRNFILNTDYQMDKIAGSITGSTSVSGSGGTATKTIPHSLGNTPLCVLKWSIAHWRISSASLSAMF